MFFRFNENYILSNLQKGADEKAKGQYGARLKKRKPKTAQVMEWSIEWTWSCLAMMGKGEENDK